MNKPLLIVLVLVALGLAAFLMMREPVKIGNFGVVPQGDQTASYEDIQGGVETQETPDFDVQVSTVAEGMRSVLEFTIIETHGWAVSGVYVQAIKGEINEETGEFEPLSCSETEPVQILCPKPIPFGEPLVCKTTVTDLELICLDGALGDNENWQTEVYKWMKVYKPAGTAGAE